MSSVTNVIKVTKQPRGGYLKPTDFTIKSLEDSNVLAEEENIHGSIVGMAVDYLTRFITGTPAKEAFSISIMGAANAVLLWNKNALKIADSLLQSIKGLDDNSIINACKLVSFDVWYRNTSAGPISKPYGEINPDKPTIENIRIMVNRSIKFFNLYGPVTVDGFTFEKDGYTETVNSGDGDFLTKDTLWDFKVSKSKPTKNHTLQLIMYYIMGKHSHQHIYDDILNIGIYNPRLNLVYLYDMRKLSKDIIEDIEKNVICY